MTNLNIMMNMEALAAHCKRLSPTALKDHLNSLIPLVYSKFASKNNAFHQQCEENGDSDGEAARPRAKANKPSFKSQNNVQKKNRNGTNKHYRFNEAVVGTQVFVKLDRLYSPAQKEALNKESISILNSVNINAKVITKGSHTLVIELSALNVCLQQTPQMFYYETTDKSSDKDISDAHLRQLQHSSDNKERRQFALLQKLCKESHRAVDTPPSLRRGDAAVCSASVPPVDKSKIGVTAPLWGTHTGISPTVVTLKRKISTKYQDSSSSAPDADSSTDSEAEHNSVLPQFSKRVKRFESPATWTSQTSSQQRYTTTTVTSCSDEQPKIRYNTMTKLYAPKFVKCAVGELVMLRLAGLYNHTAVSQMEQTEQQILKFTTVDATVISKTNETCVMRIEGLSNVYVHLSRVQFEKNVNMVSGGEDRVHHNAHDLSNLLRIDREEYKLIMCLIEQSTCFVREKKKEEDESR